MSVKMKAGIIFFFLFNYVGVLGVFSQTNDKISPDELAGQVNTITTAVSFLKIAPDSRSGAMGNAGVALSPDANAMHWNPSKYAFVQDNMGTSLSYTPWLREIIDDINLSYLSFYRRLDDRQTLAASLKYFSMGSITFTKRDGSEIGTFNPHEFSLDAAYALKLSEHMSGGIALRYIYSNLTGGHSAGSNESHPGRSIASDISTYYTSDKFSISDKSGELAFGLNISNIGAKISYTNESQQNFIPTNMRIGGAFTLNLDKFNSLTFTTDLNKLLVPTPPEIREDTTGSYSIYAGYDSDVSVARGIFRSFYDAPGGIKEELHEIKYSLGLEYWYANQFAIRAGYFHEHETKGNRKFFTAGLGLKLNVLGINFSYLTTTQQRNPLENTLRFSLYFNFNQQKSDNNNEDGS